MQSERPDNIVLVTLTFEVGLAVLAVAIGRWAGEMPSDFVSWNLQDAFWGVLATLPMLAGLGACLWVPWRPLVELRKLVEAMVVPLFRDCSLWQLALISVAAGLGEELLFRGLIQHFLSAWWGVPAGLVVASVLFGLAHYLSTAYLVLATLIGVYLGWLWIAVDNLLAPIIAHALYDFVALAVILRQRSEPDDADESDE